MDLSRRLKFQGILEELLGSRNVYFQPTNNTSMKYPAIVYELDQESVDHADNRKYRMQRRYSVTCIDQDPDSETPTKLSMLPYSSFNRFFVQDTLNHTVYTIHY